LENAIEEGNILKRDAERVLAKAGDTAQGENVAFRWKSSNPCALARDVVD
jgi:hypothetical protein